MIDKKKLKEFAYAHGAQLIAVTGVDPFEDYISEVRSRMNDTGVGFEDYMLPGESFFDTLSDPQRSMPGVKSIILIGVYSYDHSAVYRNTRSTLKGKTARIYSYYPVARQVAKNVVELIEKEGGRAVHGQHIPLKYLAHQTGLATYGKNGILQTPKYGSHLAFRNILTDMELHLTYSKKSNHRVRIVTNA